jgi:hypothetical protein
MKAQLLSALAAAAGCAAQGPFGPPPPPPTQGIQTLLVPSDAEGNARFGYDVAVAGSVCIVGAFGSHGGNAGTGAAYIFRQSDKGDAWVQEYELLPDTLQAGDYLGRAVAIAGTTHGDVAVACAPRANSGAGQCYLFRKTQAGAWVVEDTLTSTGPSQGFGSSVAIAGDTVVVGAQNAAYVFAHRSGAWPQQAALVAPNGQAGFGTSVAATASAGAETDLVVVGAPGAGVFSYRYYTMRGHTDPTWNLEGAALVPASGSPSAGFGSSVALSGTLLAVGAYDEDGEAGAAYIFARQRNGQ